MGKRSFLFKLVLGIFLGLFVLTQVQAETIYPTGLKAKKDTLPFLPMEKKLYLRPTIFRMDYVYSIPKQKQSVSFRKIRKER